MKKKENYSKAVRETRGITLVALVITIVILIILAVVAINAVFGDSGLLQYAQDARNYQANADSADSEMINSATEYIDGIIRGDNSGGGDTPEEPTKSELVQAKEDGTVFQDKTELEDEHGNKVIIPGGFKVAEESGDTVQQGVVIEDVSASTDENVQGSQYVWIPVGTFIKDDGTTSEEIKLGRYTFDETNGTPNLEQDAANYLESVEIIGSCVEEPTYRVGIESTGINALNATAKDLAGFIDSVNVNKGYYIGRYEASYASGSSTADYKAASKISATYSEAGMEYNSGTLWNYIKQMDASKVGINTYADSTSVKSDLINSYA